MTEQADAEAQAVTDQAPGLAEDITGHLKEALGKVAQEQGIGMESWTPGDDEVVLGFLTRYTEFVTHSQGFQPGGNFHAGLLYHTFEKAFYDDGTLVQQVQDYMGQEERPQHFARGLELGEATAKDVVRNSQEAQEAPVATAFCSHMRAYFRDRG